MNASTLNAHAGAGGLDDRAFARLMADAGLSPNNVAPRMAVAVSGGADSMCLAVLAHRWAATTGGRLVALTVDHGLRKASTDEARQVATWLHEYGIRHHTLTWEHAAQKSGAVQARAREARYRLMTAWCREHAVSTLLLAHHLEDQSETFLMRLAKGSSVMGLAAMTSQRRQDGVTLVRPLLTVPKGCLRETLGALNQPWIEDPSNGDPAFERVRTRRLLAALGHHEGIPPWRFAAAAEGAHRLRRLMEGRIDTFLAGHGKQHGDGWSVDHRAFLRQPDALQAQLLSHLIRRVGGGAYPPRQAKIEHLRRWAAGQATGAARTLGGVRLGREAGESGGRLVFRPESGRRKKAVYLVERGKLPYIKGTPTQPPGLPAAAHGGEISAAAPCGSGPGPHL